MFHWTKDMHIQLSTNSYVSRGWFIGISHLICMRWITDFPQHSVGSSLSISLSSFNSSSQEPWTNNPRLLSFLHTPHPVHQNPKFNSPDWPSVKCSCHYTHPTWTCRNEKLREDWWPPELLWKWVTWDIVTCCGLPAGSHGWGWLVGGEAVTVALIPKQKKWVLIFHFSAFVLL